MTGTTFHGLEHERLNQKARETRVALAAGSANGVGDINSDAAGSGARYNTGKAPMELIPASMIAGSVLTHQDANRAMAWLGLWQEGGGRTELLGAIRELGMGGWTDCAFVFEYGRKKYVAWNWAKGMQWSVPFACAQRHLLAMISGEEFDPESNLPHRGHVFCNIVMLWTYHETFLQGDDRPARGLLCNPSTKSEN